MFRTRGKILIIKKSYTPNCSSGMWYLGYIIFFGFLGIPVSTLISLIVSKLLKTKHEKKFGLKKETKLN